MTATIPARRTQRRRSSFEWLQARAVRDPDTGCLLAPNGRADRYATCQDGGRTRGAHRIAFEIAYGPIPPGAMVLHSCVGRRNCIERRHLHRGDAPLNSLEMVSAGRSTRGERNPRAKLLEADVRRIRSALRSGPARRELAAKYGIHPNHVSAVQRGVFWGWLPAEMAAT